MKTLEMTGKTVEEAVKKALSELEVTKDKVEVEVIDEGSKGFLNIIGTKPAKIIVKVKKDHVEEARSFLMQVLNSMGIEAEIEIKQEKRNLKINLSGPNMGLLIGYRGDTLDSLQYLVSLVINKNHEEEYVRVVLDTENYRARREETLIKLAKKVAYKVERTKSTIKLEPMNPYERRVIHSALQDDQYVNTYSEGDEPFRRVVIDLKKA